jgi:hypothetical protein
MPRTLWHYAPNQPRYRATTENGEIGGCYNVQTICEWLVSRSFRTSPQLFAQLISPEAVPLMGWSR